MAVDYKKLEKDMAQRARLLKQGIYTPPVRGNDPRLIHQKEIRTQYIKGSPERVDMEMNKFYASMQKKYPSFQIISVNTTSVPIGVAVHITYSVRT